MFKYNRAGLIFLNLITSFTIFIIVYLLRYTPILNLIYVNKMPLNSNTILWMLIYSITLIFFNTALKIYEIKKIIKLNESIISGYISSFFTISLIGGIFYIFKLDFARFVLISGIAVIPIINSIVNKGLFLIRKKNQRIVKVLFAGADKNFLILDELVKKYKKYFNIEIVSNDLSEISKKSYNLIIVDTDYRFNENDTNRLNNYELDGGNLYSLIDLFAYLDESLPAEIIQNNHYEYFSTYKLDSFYIRYIKRIFDILISVFLLTVLSPIILFIYLFILIIYKTNPIYIQNRTGINQKIFRLYKFKTMYNDSEKDGVKLTIKNDSRITIIGKLIRPFRIDELPQLYNILKGDMSFIGPRPERPELITEIIKRVPLFKKRLLVKPGLTGWAQVKYNYVNEIDDMSHKLRYDLYYIKNLSATLDFKILLYTLETVIFKRGAM